VMEFHVSRRCRFRRRGWPRSSEEIGAH